MEHEGHREGFITLPYSNENGEKKVPPQPPKGARIMKWDFRQVWGHDKDREVYIIC